MMTYTLDMLKEEEARSYRIAKECWKDLLPKCKACNPWHVYISDVMGGRSYRSRPPCDSCKERLAVVKEVKKRIQEEKEKK